MRREDFHYLVSILLMFSIIAAAALGYLQSQLELRRFVPHRYFAYATLAITAIHVYLNWKKVWRFVQKKIKG